MRRSGLRRRNFVQLAAQAMLAAGCRGADVRAPRAWAARDRYGGWTQLRFEPTGVFRTEHDGRRWWLVTPDGHAFVSFGINHYHASWWSEDYNRRHWLESFGARAVGDEAWQRGFRRSAGGDLRWLGLNTLGYHTDAPMLTEGPRGAILPYLRRYRPIELAAYGPLTAASFVDVFEAAFEGRCADAAEAAALGHAEDPMLLGYVMEDIPLLTDWEAGWFGTTTWPRALRRLGPEAAGKRAYVELMRQRHGEVAAFNAVYDTAFSSWDALAHARDWRADAAPTGPREAEDNQAFLLKIVERYYAVAAAELRRVDPHHLFFGDKLNANGDALETVLPVTRHYTDVVYFQYFERWPAQRGLLDALTGTADLPIINGDATFSVPSEVQPRPHGPHARDQAQRARWLQALGEGLFAHLQVVGWHICGMLDVWKRAPGFAEFQHQGLMTATGEFYPEVAAVIRQLSAGLYTLADDASSPREPRERGTVTSPG